jgi:hypothetical protein
MAKMFPPHGPDQECQSLAEKELYTLLKAQLDNHFYVIHSAWWHAEDEQGRPQDGEADFMIIHPDYGVLIIEVKGSAIDYRSREWFQLNRKTQQWNKIGEDPQRQARKSKYALRQILRKNFRLHSLKECPIGYAVWFPDMRWPGKYEDTLQGQKHFLLDSADKNHPQERLIEIFRHFRGNVAPPVLDKEGLDVLLHIIEQTGEIDPVVPGLPPDSHLKPEQFAKLQEIWRGQRQMVITGCAGSGKTVLAISIATRLAMEGYKILFLVKSPHMATSLRIGMEGALGENRPTFDLYDIEGLARTLARRGGRCMQLLDTPDITTATGQQKLRTLFNANIEVLEKRDPNFFFDGIVIDDAEDFEQPLSGEIQKLRKDRRNGFLYVFQDEKQRMTVQDRWNWHFIVPGKPTPAALTENWRNADEIFALMKGFYPTLERSSDYPHPRGSVLFLDQFAQITDAPSQLSETEALIQALKHFSPVGLSPEQILVITMRGREKSCWNTTENRKEVNARSPFSLRWFEREDQPHLRSGKVGVTTINLAKGIEYEGVILTELDGLDGRQKKNIRQALSYVGVSRAKQHLIILGTREQFLPPSLWTMQ